MTTQVDQDLRQRYIHYTSWACLIGGPIILALPPRKLDLYTLGILIGIFAGANEVSREQTGISMIDRIGQRLARSTAALPPQAVELQQRRQREERERTRKMQDVQRISYSDNSLHSTTNQEAPVDQKKSTGFWHKVWMGGEDENWREERLRKEREALESGKGYFDLIKDQVWEVWNSDQSDGEKKTELEVKSTTKKNGLGDDEIQDDERNSSTNVNNKK
ncbi:putative rhomboid family membrane protein [Golovinomyces cichoracearum]|uniref:Putative rhomboid family membrane protein n=1 Tax=Golovinomyces cichoracearum TaxID=62708 RepID=A0A420HZJ2_9PEZI|nr:putative rhomboid family membrane protein [Golovinomyces cichoracearum]